MRRRVLLVSLLIASVPLASIAAGTHDCAALAKLALPHARIDSAHVTAAGTFAPSDAKPGQPLPAVFRNAPAFCRVQATLTPSSKSNIKAEVWLPLEGWNERFRGVGNGGFAGYINHDGLATAIDEGYASASTDTGHDRQDARWALGHPQKILDYGYRAMHAMTVLAKAVMQRFYGTPSRYSYFAGCSNGGRQALMEAQRYPADYDGIIAGDPAADWTHLMANALGVAQHASSPTGYIPPAKLPIITHAALAACDAGDGVVDGVIGDPPHCRFNPDVLLCKRGSDPDGCLTASQVATVRAAYDGTRDHAGKPIFHGLMPGAEDVANGGWGVWITGMQRGKSAYEFFVDNYFRNMVYHNRKWQLAGANIDAALALAQRRTGMAMNAVDPDLQPFFARRGKLILYHGWSDPAISPLATVHYFDAVTKTLGRHTASASMRLYVVPGMLHCNGGPGTNDFGQPGTTASKHDPQHDMFDALVQWVEQGIPPAAIIATKYTDDDPGRPVVMTRPLCPWPQVARYDGHGNTNSATSFTCAATRAIRGPGTLAPLGAARRDQPSGTGTSIRSLFQTGHPVANHATPR
ncbi:MAG TPA: tannase/feruloyl esterase family alpha/beta hydrolase [Rhodanobacteraceae bacterium]|nr:tannase/feruloyl esterase family alpha/beta hydrolase [Rhodanobacteraceae bacterium]